MRALLTLLLLGIGVFALAFAARHIFLADVLPVAAAEEPQSIWALETAFALRTIENVAAIVTVIVLGAITVLWFGRLTHKQVPKP